MAEHKHKAWTLLGEFEAAAKAFAADPAAQTAEEAAEIEKKRQQVFAAAATTVDKQMGEINMAVADISKATGLDALLVKAKQPKPLSAQQ